MTAKKKEIMQKYYHFGQYLVKVRLVTEENILHALKYQKKNTMSFEEAALKLDVLSMKKVFHIMTLQVDSDLSVEELAVMHDFITPPDISLINNYIEEKKPSISECLVNLKYIASDVLDTAFTDYKRATSKYIAIANSIRTINLFKNVKDSAFTYLAKIAKKEIFEENQRIISENEDATSFYALVSGCVNITRSNPAKPENEIFICEIREKDVFGESCVFEKGKRTANITSNCKTTLLRFERDDFIAFLQNHPKSSFSIFIFLIQRLMVRLENISREFACEHKHITNPNDVKNLLDEFVK